MFRLSVALIAAISAIAFTPIASAADLPVRAPVYKAPVAITAAPIWTGCYVGGNVGYGWAPKKWNDPLFAAPIAGELASHSADGVVGGGQIGCDYQSGVWVLGVQGMFDASGMKGHSLNTFALAEGFAVTDTSRVSWIATLTGRLGYTIQPITLLYVKGGAAWVRDKFDECCLAPNVDAVLDGFANVTRTGWTVGVGLEHKFAPNWSAFVEYDFIGLGTRSVAFTGINGFGPFTYNIDQDIHSVLVGVNYRFSGGSPVAKY